MKIRMEFKSSHEKRKKMEINFILKYWKNGITVSTKFHQKNLYNNMIELKYRFKII